ncbi:MAG: hypothetical protein ABI666_00990 [Ferruginibacter sp.]
MNPKRIFIIPSFLLISSLFILSNPAKAAVENDSGNNIIYTSTQQEAIAFIDKITNLEPSAFWPNIKASLFLQNLKTNIYKPLSIYPGRATNFCGYGALSYLLLQDDPLGYAKFILQLYKAGKASFGKVTFNPSPGILKAAGGLKYKGRLDIRPAEQMWFLVLADHFKGYLNIFNRNYDPGDEDRFWASVNYAKFNRMIKKLLQYKVIAKGADLTGPRVGDQYNYITEKMKTGTVVLFINNRIVHKKNHVAIKLGVPTHFVVVQQITKVDGLITLVYWDYGSRTLMQLSPSFLRKITFGITYCTKQGVNEN